MRQTHQKSKDKKEEGQPAHSWEKIAVFIFCVAFVAAMLSIAVFIPAPTDFQVFVFRVVLALAASGIGAVVPGFLHVEWKPKTKLCIRAGGAIALLAEITPITELFTKILTFYMKRKATNNNLLIFL